MGKIAFIYPGQGAQKIGMGKDFYETKPNARRIFDEADKVLDFDIKNICFEENSSFSNSHNRLFFCHSMRCYNCRVFSKA